jgi:DNA repair protein RecN (Recombination protein N)
VLTEIQISNFAIIENQSIAFSDGLNILTGETGSGKSIILDALGLILGERASSSLIRQGSEHLEVHAHFDLSDIDLAIMNSLPDITKGKELAVSRIFSINGRSKVYINGNLSTVSVLTNIGNQLISICSQSQQINLLNPSYHLKLLDGYVAKNDLFNEYAEKFSLFKQKELELNNLKQALKARESRLLILEEMIDELEALNITDNLRVELESAFYSIQNSVKVKEKSAFLQDLVTGEEGLLSLVSKITSFVSELNKLNPSYTNLVDIVTNLKEYSFELDRQINSSLNNDEDSKLDSDDISEKLTKLARLERKYSKDSKGLKQLLEDSKKEILTLQNPVLSIEQLQKEVSTVYNQVKVLAEKISDVRKKAASELSKLVRVELSELNMNAAKFEVEFKKLPELTLSGLDSVEFLLQSNAGDGLRPLKQIASGGELSRILLVLKKVLRDKSGVNVLVFDEVDTGISGSVARSVGAKLKELASNSQVICITHLPQVASFADHHLLVEKFTDVKAKKTTTAVKLLNKNERVNEIARMLSGFEVTPTTKKSALELIERA